MFPYTLLLLCALSFFYSFPKDRLCLPSSKCHCALCTRQCKTKTQSQLVYGPSTSRFWPTTNRWHFGYKLTHSIAKGLSKPWNNIFKYLSVLLLYSCVFSSMSTEIFPKCQWKQKKATRQTWPTLPSLINTWELLYQFYLHVKTRQPSLCCHLQNVLENNRNGGSKAICPICLPSSHSNEGDQHRAGWCWGKLLMLHTRACHTGQAVGWVVYFLQLKTNQNGAALRDHRLSHQRERNCHFRQELYFSNSCLLVPGSV